MLGLISSGMFNPRTIFAYGYGVNNKNGEIVCDYIFTQGMVIRNRIDMTSNCFHFGYIINANTSAIVISESIRGLYFS